MRRAFTLIEVTLALGILGMGVMAFVGLYSFGYREANQSREDVAATAVADYVLGQLVAAASATNVSWEAFRNLGDYPAEKWVSYVGNQDRPTGNPTAIAQGAFNGFLGQLGANGMSFQFPGTTFGGEELEYGLVILHEKDSPIVRFAFRATKQRQMFLMTPLFYTEAMFQGVRK